MAGGDYYFDKIRQRFSGTNVGTSSGVTTTRTGTTGFRQTVTGVQCSGDAAAVVTIESPSGTKLFQKRFAAAFTMSETFPPGVIVGPADADILVKVSASTSNSEANLQGYQAK